MVGVMLSADDISTAPQEVRLWLQQQVLLAVGAIRNMHSSIHPGPLPAVVDPEVKTSGMMALAPPNAKPCELSEAPRLDQRSEPDHRAALQKLIAERAYELWEHQGRPQGCDLIHWREAEKDIMARVKGSSSSHDSRLTQ